MRNNVPPHDCSIELNFAEQNVVMQQRPGEDFIILQEIDLTPQTKLDDHFAYHIVFLDSYEIYLIRHNGKLSTCEASEFPQYIQSVQDYKKAF